MLFKKTLLVGLVAAALAVAPAAAATAAVTGTNATNAGGGMWQYGITGTLSGTVYSNYHHATKYHTATACDGALFKTCKQSAAAAGSWAKAATVKSNGGNTAFWNTL